MKNSLPFHPVREGLAAARQNLVPGLVIQAFLLVLVLSWAFVPAVRPFFDGWAALKDRGGFVYSALATAFFGGLVPFLYLRLHPGTRASTPWAFLAFYVLFWAYKGIEIDLLYQVEAALFGTGNAAANVVPKVVFDQFVYNPLWAAPVQILAYHWMHSGYSRKAFAGFDWREFFLRKVPTTLLSTWGVWIPLVTLVYCLPVALQLPVANLALCFWVLLFSTLTRPRD